MAVKTVFSIVLFFALLGMFLVGLGISAVNYQTVGGSYTNQTLINMTKINTGLSNVQVCDYHSDIPIIGNLIWGADCIGDGLNVLIGLSTASTDNLLLGTFFLACVITLIILTIMILRGSVG
jgi:hypothetical protein